MRTEPKNIGETFIQYDPVHRIIIGKKKVAKGDIQVIEKEIRKREKQDVIAEVREELEKL